MSQISPYTRSKKERQHNWRATSIFLGVTAGVFFLSAWLIDPTPPNPQPEPPEPPVTISQTDDVEAVPSRVPAPEAVETSFDWSARFAEVQRELPHHVDPKLEQLESRLQSVASQLENMKLPANRGVSIQEGLVKLKDQAKMLAVQFDRPTVDANDIDEAVTSAVQALVLAEREAIRQAREQAEQLVREDLKPAIRAARLQTSDSQDRATALRKQISQAQRDQAELKNKVARLARLKSDMPDIQRYLKPFIEAGHLQPKSEKSAWDGEITPDAKPVSLMRLTRLGALEDTMDGKLKLYIFGGGKNPALRNDRPLGVFPQYWAKHLERPEVLKVINRAQQLLRDHGRALVEEHLLSP